MSTLEKAAQQALEALDAFSWEQVDAARIALRAALAEPVQQTERDALRADAERWQFIASRMAHQHRGDACGWTLDELLIGDDPDAAIDAAREAK